MMRQIRICVTLTLTAVSGRLRQLRLPTGWASTPPLPLTSEGIPASASGMRPTETLRFAFYEDGWQAETVEATNKVGQYTSLALDSIGNPHISYWNETNRALQYTSITPLLGVWTCRQLIV